MTEETEAQTEEQSFTPSSLESVLGRADDAPSEPEGQSKTESEGEEKQVEAETPEDTSEASQEEEQESPSEEEGAEEKSKEDDNVVRMRKSMKALKEENERLKAAQKQKERPDVFEDPDGAFRHTEEQINQRIMAMSEEMARAQFDDYDERLERVQQEAQEHPAILEEIRGSAHPAMKAYEVGKRLASYDEIGDPEDFKAKVREQIREEEREKLKAEESEKTKESLPDDLTSERNAGSRSGPAWPGPTPLEEILPE